MKATTTPLSPCGVLDFWPLRSETPEVERIEEKKSRERKFRRWVGLVERGSVDSVSRSLPSASARQLPRPWKFEVILAERFWRTPNSFWTRTRRAAGPWSCSTRPAGESAGSTGPATVAAKFPLNRTMNRTSDLTPMWWCRDSRPRWRIRTTGRPQRGRKTRGPGDPAAPTPPTASAPRWISHHLGTHRGASSFRDRDWSCRFIPTRGRDVPARRNP